MQFLLLLVCLFAPATSYAGESSSLSEFIGVFQAENYIRDMSVDCAGSESELCGIEKVIDEVEISREIDSSVNIRIELMGASFHTCTAKGTGEYVNGVIVMHLEPDDEDYGSCTVQIKKSSDGSLQITSEPLDNCRYYCGANISIDSDNLRRVRK